MLVSFKLTFTFSTSCTLAKSEISRGIATFNSVTLLPVFSSTSFFISSSSISLTSFSLLSSKFVSSFISRKISTFLLFLTASTIFCITAACLPASSSSLVSVSIIALILSLLVTAFVISVISSSLSKDVSERFAAPTFVLISVPYSYTFNSSVTILILLISLLPVKSEIVKI